MNRVGLLVCLMLCIIQIKSSLESRLRFFEYCTYLGYPVEAHTVRTTDTYNLPFFRVQGKMWVWFSEGHQNCPWQKSCLSTAWAGRQRRHLDCQWWTFSSRIIFSKSWVWCLGRQLQRQQILNSSSQPENKKFLGLHIWRDGKVRPPRSIQIHPQSNREENPLYRPFPRNSNNVHRFEYALCWSWVKSCQF